MSTVNSDAASVDAEVRQADARQVAPDPRRWRALALICGLQFMLVLDGT